jgi:transcriptional regulator with XRE-family HTH domain
MHSTVRKRRTQAQRELILQDYQDSQLTQAEFAERAGLSVSTLQLWLRKYSASTPPQSRAFIEVPNLLGQASTAPAYRIELGSGISLELSSGFKPEELALLLQLLRAQ